MCHGHGETPNPSHKRTPSSHPLNRPHWWRAVELLCLALENFQAGRVMLQGYPERLPVARKAVRRGVAVFEELDDGVVVRHPTPQLASNADTAAL